MSKLQFKSEVHTINQRMLTVLPPEQSAKLPSRGQTMVQGNINDFRFQQALEPDGRGSHWLDIDKAMQMAAHVKAGDTVDIELESMKDWPEPDVPEDILSAMMIDEQVKKLWDDISPMARWEWIRWIRATRNPDTRKKRIIVSVSKLKAGDRRPCCFNRTMCTDPDVSKGGVLLDPTGN